MLNITLWMIVILSGGVGGLFAWFHKRISYAAWQADIRFWQEIGFLPWAGYWRSQKARKLYDAAILAAAFLLLALAIGLALVGI